MSKNEASDFLTFLEDDKTIKVSTTTKKVNLKPLSFKQQKSLVTASLDGIAGVMSFIRNLNTIILENTGESELSVVDRIPLTLQLKKSLGESKIEKDEKVILVDDLIALYTPYDGKTEEVVEGVGYSVNLKIPSIKKENKDLFHCIDILKKNTDEKVGDNVGVILSQEILKFIDNVTFGEKTINFDTLSVIDKGKILDKFPADITNKISDFIFKVKEYDEQLLTIDGVTIDIDSTFFE